MVHWWSGIKKDCQDRHFRWIGGMASIAVVSSVLRSLWFSYTTERFHLPCQKQFNAFKKNNDNDDFLQQLSLTLIVTANVAEMSFVVSKRSMSSSPPRRHCLHWNFCLGISTLDSYLCFCWCFKIMTVNLVVVVSSLLLLFIDFEYSIMAKLLLISIIRS